VTYHDDINTEASWNSSETRPGVPKPNRTSEPYKRGVTDYYAGRTGKEMCPYLGNGEAARNWHAGQDDADKESHRRDKYVMARAETGTW
jgi:hypothetical protein